MSGARAEGVIVPVRPAAADPAAGRAGAVDLVAIGVGARIGAVLVPVRQLQQIHQPAGAVALIAIAAGALDVLDAAAVDLFAW